LNRTTIKSEIGMTGHPIVLQRPLKGRAIFYHRDSGGQAETTPEEYARWASDYCFREGLAFTVTPQQITALIQAGKPHEGDVFVDWCVKGNKLSRLGLNALMAEVARDKSISHVLIFRADRLARPKDVHEGMQLEMKLRRLGVDVVFRNRTAHRLSRNERIPMKEWFESGSEYENAGAFRRDLSEKMIRSQVNRARNGISTGGRPMYGLRRWLVDSLFNRVRALEDGESVKRSGHHVVWIPKEDDTFKIRCWIKRELFTRPATQIAKELTLRKVPTPDHGRSRTDNGTRHQTSGVWHATTVSGIGRSQIDSGIVEYGRRSMGDQLRMTPDGPRELTDADFRDDNEETKVVRNLKSQVIEGQAHFDPSLTRDQQCELDAVLDRRAGSQRGKPRSRTPQDNPLGVRIFDIDCGWPMYRATVDGTFRYRCGLYTQSHGVSCKHNQIDGLTATRFALSVLRQQVLTPERMKKLYEWLEEMAKFERTDDSGKATIASLKTELVKTTQQLDLASRNMSLADTENQRKRTGIIVDELAAREEELKHQINHQSRQQPQTSDIHTEAMAAMSGLASLTEITDGSDLATIKMLFDAVNVRLFLKFRDEQCGKRTVRRLISGVLTMGTAPAPIKIYQGPTARNQLPAVPILSSDPKETAALLAAVREGSPPSGLLFPQEVLPEEDSLGKLHRGDRI
jgi:hypothetical protein